MTCKPNDHNPRYDGAGTYRCGECGARFILMDAIEAACEIEEINQLDVREPLSFIEGPAVGFKKGNDNDQ